MTLLIRIANWKLIIWTSIFFLLFVFFFISINHFKIENFTGFPFKTLDHYYNYNTVEVKTFFRKLTNDGLDAYQFMLSTVYMIFPFTYALLLTSLTSKICLSMNRFSSKLSFIPLYNTIDSFLI